MGRPYKSGKASKYEPIEYRAWFLRLMYNLRDCRLEQDIPAREIRAMGGPNAAAVAKLENGYERDMKVSTLFRWCRVMGVSVHEMIP